MKIYTKERKKKESINRKFENGCVIMCKIAQNFNSLPNNEILESIKLKAFAGNKINMAKMMISVFDKIENIVGKGKNAVYQHFLLFPQCFQMCSSSVIKMYG